MVTVPGETTWGEASALLAALCATGFLVSWIVTEVVGWSRRVYVAVLMLLTVTATAAVLGATGTSFGQLFGHRWPVGAIVGLAVGILLGLGMRRAERSRDHVAGPALPVTLAWEGLLYGIAEGVLLSVLPTFVAWQAAGDAEWSTAAAAVAAFVASTAMITIHHFGYWDYRGRNVALAIVGCGLLTLSYLVTGSALAPTLGHVVMHTIGVSGGVKLPPHTRPLDAGVPVSTTP